MFETEVARGAAWLDENHPGWERHIDLSTLDMSNCQHCIVGQALWAFAAKESYEDTAGYFFSGMVDVLPITDPWTVHSDLRSPSDHGFDGDDYAELEKTWTALLKERFVSGLLSDLT